MGILESWIDYKDEESDAQSMHFAARLVQIDSWENGRDDGYS